MGRSSRRQSGLEPSQMDLALITGSRATARALRRIQSSAYGDHTLFEPEEAVPAPAPKRSAKRKSGGNENVSPPPVAKKAKAAPKPSPSQEKKKKTPAKKAPAKSAKAKSVKEAKPSPAQEKKKTPAKSKKKAANTSAVENFAPGDFKRGKSLGKGRFGEVFKVSTSSGGQYAMKVVSAGGKPQLQKYEQELALHSLAGEHGIAPKIVASWLSTSKPRKGHIVMEIVEGPHFKELAQDPEKHKSKAVAALKKIQMLHALPGTDGMVERLLACQKQDDSGSHQIGILHADLNKLDNILWDNELQEPFLIDFGLSQWLEQKVKDDMDKHTRMLKDIDIQKKIGFWRSFDTGHIKAKFKL